MNQKLKDEIYEVVRLITIEKRLGKASITNEDADFVKSLADKKRYPRAEYVLARMYLCGYQLEKDKELGLKYLARSSRHASYDIQFKIAYIYYIFAEYGKLRECLSKAMDDCFYLND
ncbi:MAG: hypothetical protein PHT30_03370 [Bacilli bacterium]|nr:hypothetical protein [Bacilli bacterium]